MEDLKSNRKRLQIDFIRRHKELFAKCYKNGKWYNDVFKGKGDGLKLVALAKSEIMYSEKTTSPDIYMPLMNIYEKIYVL
jgi:hypothetical protein